MPVEVTAFAERHRRRLVFQDVSEAWACGQIGTGAVQGAPRVSRTIARTHRQRLDTVEGNGFGALERIGTGVIEE